MTNAVPTRHMPIVRTSSGEHQRPGVGQTLGRRRTTTVGVLATIPIVVAAVSYGVDRSAPCLEYRWSRPDTLRGPDGASFYVETPQVLRGGDSLFVIGAPTFARDARGRLLARPTDNRGDKRGAGGGSSELAGVRTLLRANPPFLGRADPIPAPP